jgi:DNA gyrase/topoisomerase IV subunit A
LISPDKIDEWIHEVEERPTSAALIIRYIANRLSELASREEELSAENIELLSGRRVEEYENRIASLEYQLELLKRQLGGEVALPIEQPVIPPTPETLRLLVYNSQGKVLCMEMDPPKLFTQGVVARINLGSEQDGINPTVLATTSQEELLFIFDTGRTVTHPVAQLPISSHENISWEGALLEEPRIKEELAAIQPMAKMPLFEFCVQASRRGYVKKIKIPSFTTHLAEDYIGSGVKLPADKTCGVTFANRESLFVLVSQEGFIFSMPVEQLPIAIEEVIRLGITDHIVSMFTVTHEPSVAFITHNGKVVHREASWLEPANSFKSRGQAILSRERRETGTRIVGAAPVMEEDYGAFLFADGTLGVSILKDLLAQGSVPLSNECGVILSFTSFHAPGNIAATKTTDHARH